MAAVALSTLSHGAGCGCKLGAAELLPIVAGLPAPEDERVIVGSASADDACVFQLRDDLALVQTVDFFTAIVDDPFDFGRIAAANAISDVYAMGGTPLTALNIVAFPLESLGADVLRSILQGGVAVAAEAGCTIVGGHSIDDPEPKYGLAVTGTVDPRRMLTNAGAREGDALVLTKPLGVGVITTAHKRGLASTEQLARAVEVMVALNAEAARAATEARAHAATDVTGFGLLGHLHSLALQSGAAAEVDAQSIPCLQGVADLLEHREAISGGTRRNLAYAESFTTFAPELEPWRRWLACDATTSGGLLIAVPPGRAEAIPGVTVGRIVRGDPGALLVV
ncbi:MAG: selD [Solirubrobacterales bacterium]|jgi:selenide,water dikinase|nr:selD [Solirubrobacterales bacterium]